MASPQRLFGTALLLVAVYMVRAYPYPQALNQTAAGTSEFGQDQQYYATGAQSSQLNRNSRPTIDHSPELIQDFARNRRQQFPIQEHSAVSRQLGNDNRPPVQQPHNPGDHSEPNNKSRRVSPQHTTSKSHSNQQNTHRAHYRSIQPRNKNVPNNNDDRNIIEKKHNIAVNTNHERNAPVSRAYPNPTERSYRVADTQRRSEALKMPPQPSIPTETRGHITVPVQGRNGTSLRGQFPQDSLIMHRTPSKSSGSQGGIVFPDQKVTFLDKFGKDVPKCSKGLTFCEDIEDYPQAQISQLIKTKIDLDRALFSIDELVPEITNRLSPDEELCKYTEEIAYPKAGINKNNEWQLIANTEEFKQGVRVEICQNSGSECLLVSGSTPMDYRTECKQKHIYRKLVSLQKETPTTEDFLFPSCCVCSIKKIEG